MSTPTARLRRLAMELRRLREAAGLTQRQVHDLTGVSTSTLNRAERGKHTLHQVALRSLLDLYGVEGDERDALLELHRTASQRGIHSLATAELPGQYPSYIAFESAASHVSMYQPILVPGLLQTPDYARALGSSDAVVDARIRRREEMLSRKDVSLLAILEINVLLRRIGNRQAMAAQRRQLLRDADLPDVSIRVLPEGATPVPAGPVTLLCFQADPPLVYIEHGVGNALLDDEAATVEVDKLFTAFKAASLDIREVKL